ncbi:MAG: D-alanine--D-serine ligase VanG [Eubacteriales bacterium]|nr:D-alanine--D-serine ligase VanG [Eubacteriales bacterium]
MMKKTIAVLFGGRSSEYGVSLHSAAAVIRCLSPERYETILLGITQKGAWFRFYGTPDEIEADTWAQGVCVPAVISPDTSHHGILEFTPQGNRVTSLDAAFPILHGQNGEDGTVQGLLKLAGIPCIGCGLLSSALCMDKNLAHKLAAQAGVQVPKSVVIDQIGDPALLEQAAKGLRYPLFVKPVGAGSSFGITRITEKEQLAEAVAYALMHDTKVIIEEAVEGFEVGCAVLGTENLLVGEVDEIELSSGFFDYTEKYTLKTSKIHMPARIERQTKERIQETAKLLYRTLRCSGFARVDCFLTPDGEIVFNEINTIPGFTSHSRYPNMMKGIGLDFSDIVEQIVETGVA